MKKQLWHQIKPILDDALDLSSEDREEFLDRACAGRPEIRSEVEELLALEDEVEASFDGPLLDLVAGRPSEFRAGQKIGPYRLVEEIGKGGMGVVYAARREEGGFEQSVAVKVLRKGFDTGDFVRRFRDERQILSDLVHPNIAHLFDGGTTSDGLPYLVMERVDGRHLDRYRIEEELELDQSLAIFLQICRAVHAAHQRLVVHCDLKPSNILVTDDGSPKLLDFGIAKIVHEDPEGMTRSLALRLGSPRYASPEQTEDSAITTASDVYSLGCVLFLLLTGEAPQPRRDAESLPAIPSRAAGKDLRSELRGDLDAIVAKATAWGPDQRYASAAALAKDVERYRSGLPVSAQTFTWRYLAGRFLRRHRKSVIIAAVGILLVVIAGAAAVAFYLQAEMEASRALGMRDAYLEMLEVYDPARDESPAKAARSAVEAILADESLRDDRDRAVIYDRMGRLFYRLEFLDQARRLLERALDLRRTEDPSDPVKLAASLNNLALVLKETGDLEEAVELYEEALGMPTGSSPTARAEQLDMLANLAEVKTDLGEIEEAERLHRETLELREILHGAHSMEVARSLNNLGKLLALDGRLDEAEPLLRRSLELRTELLGDRNPSVATALVNLAALLDSRGANDEAIELFRRALQLRQHEVGDQHPKLARARSALGYALLGRGQAGDVDEARRLLEQARSTYLEAYGIGHEVTRIIQRNLAAAYLAAGEPERAETLLREALENSGDWRKRFSWRLADAQSLLGECLMTKGDLEGAEPFLRDAWATIEKQRGAESRPAREARQRWQAWTSRRDVAGRP